MPRLTGASVPKCRKHRASGQAVCTINGRDHYLGPHKTKASKIEYDRLIGEWLANGRQPVWSAKAQGNSDMVGLQRLTGMRPAEVCMIRPCDLDRTNNVWTYRPGSHKTEHHGRQRQISIGPQAQAVLLRYLGLADLVTHAAMPAKSCYSLSVAARFLARKFKNPCG